MNGGNGANGMNGWNGANGSGVAPLAVVDGLWTLGEPLTVAPPLVQAAQARGAVLEWELGGADVPVITLTDPAAADWLWRLVGEDAHARILAAAADTDARRPGNPGQPAREPLTVTPDWSAPLLGELRRLAHGHWLRAWWPASALDVIPALDAPLLLAEIALAAVDLDDVLYESADAADGPELAGLSRLTNDLLLRAGSTDRRVADLAVRALDLLEVPAPETTAPYRDDYALAAGAPGRADDDAILTGTAGVTWQAVRAGVLDASESAVRWSLDAAGHAELRVEVAVLADADPTGIPVAARVGEETVTDELDAGGAVTMPLELAPAAAWGLAEEDVTVEVGVGAGARAGAADGVRDLAESREMRDRVRVFARGRLDAADGADGAGLGPGAPYIAEIMAARFA